MPQNNIIALIYPHQLFEDNPLFNKANLFLIIKDSLFYDQYNFHKQKIIFHDQSIAFYKKYLESKNIPCHIVNEEDLLNYNLKQNKVIFCTLEDNWLEKKVKKLVNKYEEIKSPYFLNSYTEIKTNFFMANFYQKQRKVHNILVNNNTPVGGKWSFDSENRSKLEKNITIPNTFHTKSFLINDKYLNNYGNYKDFIYPTNFKESKNNFENFLNYKFLNYGKYQDAICSDQTFLFHSVISPSLNSGLLTPKYVIDRSIEFANENNIPLNSLEGFIRQILGWREYVRIVYRQIGTKQRTTNFFNFQRKIPKSFWNATTGILPIDDTINKTINYAYNHHIERLMILGNFMLLCEFHPDQVYQWFMEMYIDSYDWVMVPNIYGMSQYADGGLIVTKPYISSSNYILKMSNYKKDSWCQIWDALFWNFIYNHKLLFINNIRMSMMIKILDKMDKKVLYEHLNTARNFLDRL